MSHDHQKTNTANFSIEKTDAPKGAPSARFPVNRPYLTMMSLYLGAFCGMFSETALNIALPQLSIAFDIEVSLAQWVVVGYMLVIGLVLPFASILMKWFALKKLTLFALGSFAIGSLISGLAPNFGIMLAGRMIQGVGTGLALPMMFALVLEIFPPNKIGSAMGITALVVMFAPAVGPTLSGIVLGALSWRFIFFILAAVLVVAIVFTFSTMINPFKLTRPRIDALSCILSCIGFGCFVAGVSVASMLGWTAAPTVILLIVGIVGIIFYVIRQLKSEAPILNLRAFRIQGFRIGSILVMVNFGITLSSMYLLPQYLQSGLLIPVALAGVFMLPGGVINACVSAIAGKLYDRVGARGPALAGFSLSAIGAIMLIFAGTDTALPYVITAHIIMMIGVPMAMSPCQTAALNALPRQLSGDGTTIQNTMQQVLGAIATAVATSLLSSGQASYLAAGGTDAAQAFTFGAHWGFTFTLVLAVIGIGFATRLKNACQEDIGTTKAENVDVVDEIAESSASSQTGASSLASSAHA